MRYYIAPDVRYNLGEGANFIAFDSLYRVRFGREGAHQVGLGVAYAPENNDRRPNDLAGEETHPNFKYWGYHRKDFNIYLWALMEQIDSKLLQCE